MYVLSRSKLEIDQCCADYIRRIHLRSFLECINSTDVTFLGSLESCFLNQPTGKVSMRVPFKIHGYNYEQCKNFERMKFKEMLFIKINIKL